MKKNMSDTHDWFDAGELWFCKKCGHSPISLGEWWDEDREDRPDLWTKSCDEIIKDEDINEDGLETIKYRKQFPPYGNKRVLND